MDRDADTTELLILGAGAVGLTGAGVVWAGAWLASAVAGTGRFQASLGDAVRAVVHLPSKAGNPAEAWPPDAATSLPGPVGYWASTLVVLAAAAVLFALAVRRLGRRAVGTPKRRRLGVDPHARFATGADLRPLVVKHAEPGRFVLGRAHRHLLATERPPTPGGRRLPAAGDRGAVALVGPSRSGKTTAAISGILEWDGPAVLSSVKADLLGATLGWRRRLGDARVYDPTDSTGRGDARWSPLRGATSLVGAQRAARALCDAAPRGGVDGGLDFWLAQAEILLCGLLWVARQTGQDMGAVLGWVLTQDRPGLAGPGEVRTLLEHLLQSDDVDVAISAAEAVRILLGIWEMEDRTRSSVYATAQTVVWPWADPGVAAAARGASVDLDWLLEGCNTLYLCAPIEDQQRLAPAFGGCLNDLVKQVYLRVASTGRPLDPPLLIVIDEAGNTPLRALPEFASTLAGLGVLLVTIWQSLAQLQAGYGRQADTILTNHLTKLFYAGLSDEASLRYVSMVLGDEEVENRSRSNDVHGGRATLQVSATTHALAPAHVLRQMRPGDALLIHGTLPPAHVKTRPYYADAALADRAAIGT